MMKNECMTISLPSRSEWVAVKWDFFRIYLEVTIRVSRLGIYIVVGANTNCCIADSWNPFQYNRLGEISSQNDASGTTLTSWIDSDCIHLLILHS